MRSLQLYTPFVATETIDAGSTLTLTGNGLELYPTNDNASDVGFSLKQAVIPFANRISLVKGRFTVDHINITSWIIGLWATAVDPFDTAPSNGFYLRRYIAQTGPTVAAHTDAVFVRGGSEVSRASIDFTPVDYSAGWNEFEFEVTGAKELVIRVKGATDHKWVTASCTLGTAFASPNDQLRPSAFCRSTAAAIGGVIVSHFDMELQ